MADFFSVTTDKIAKTLIFCADEKTVAVVIRGDRMANEVKILNAIKNTINLEPADVETVMRVTGAEIGFDGPINLKVDCGDLHFGGFARV